MNLSFLVHFTNIFNKFGGSYFHYFYVGLFNCQNCDVVLILLKLTNYDKYDAFENTREILGLIEKNVT